MSRSRPVTIDAVRKAVQDGHWALTQHARERAGKRRVGDEALACTLAAGEILEDYPDDPRGPSALVLGHSAEGLPLHAVCAFDPGGALMIITVYEPEPPRWINERTRRWKGAGLKW